MEQNLSLVRIISPDYKKYNNGYMGLRFAPFFLKVEL